MPNGLVWTTLRSCFAEAFNVLRATAPIRFCHEAVAARSCRSIWTCPGVTDQPFIAGDPSFCLLMDLSLMDVTQLGIRRVSL